MKTQIFYLIVILTALFILNAISGCNKAQFRDSQYTPYCADTPQQITDKCVYTCDGQYARKENDVTFYYDNEQDCLYGPK